MNKKDDKISITIEAVLPKYGVSYKSKVLTYPRSECERVLEKAKDPAAIVIPMLKRTVVIPPELAQETVLILEGIELDVAEEKEDL